MRGRRLVGFTVICLALAGCTSRPGIPAAVPTTTTTAGPTAGTTALAGALYYFPDYTPDGQTPDGAVYRWPTDGTKVDRHIAVDWLDGTLSLTVSPDGKRVAWVGAADATLYVANVDGTGKKAVKKSVSGDCHEPAWSGDGRRVIAQPLADDRPGEAGSLDVDGGTFTAFPSSYDGCHAQWSADGSTLVYVGGGIFLANPDGSASRALKKPDGSKWPGNDLASVSPDGKRIALWLPAPGQPAGDVARSLYVNTIIDATTGAKVEPDHGGELVQAIFTPDGGILARVKVGSRHEIVLLSAAGAVVARKPEPSEVKSMTLLAYVP